MVYYLSTVVISAVVGVIYARSLSLLNERYKLTTKLSLQKLFILAFALFPLAIAIVAPILPFTIFFITTILAFFPAEIVRRSRDTKGIGFSFTDSWKVSTPLDISTFLLEVPTLVPDGSTLYIEGINIAPAIKDYLAKWKSDRIVQVHRAIKWPQPEIFHMMITRDSMFGLSILAKTNVDEICNHIHIYNKSEVLVDGHDFPDCILVSAQINEDKLHRFCTVVGCSYEKTSHPDAPEQSWCFRMQS